MDEFSWGNTRLVVGEGKEKKVLMNDDEKFDDSMIPLKKFSGTSFPLPACSALALINAISEYEAEAWETGSRHSDDTGYDSKSRSRSHAPPRSQNASPLPYQQASQSGDYYRDTNMTYNNSSNPNLRLGGSQLSHSNISSHHGQQPPMSQFAPPQLPMMPFGGGPGSAGGSDYGHMPMGMPPMEFLDQRWFVLMRVLVSQPPSVLVGKSRAALFHVWCSSNVGLFYECSMRSSLE